MNDVSEPKFTSPEGTPPPEGFKRHPGEKVSWLSHRVGVPSDMLQSALDSNVGTTFGRMAISSDFLDTIGDQLDPHLKSELERLPNIPIAVSHKTDDRWEITVGKRVYEADRATMEKVLKGELEDPDGSSIVSND